MNIHSAGGGLPAGGSPGETRSPPGRWRRRGALVSGAPELSAGLRRGPSREGAWDYCPGSGPLQAVPGTPKPKHQLPPPRAVSYFSFPFTWAAWQSKDVDLGSRDGPAAQCGLRSASYFPGLHLGQGLARSLSRSSVSHFGWAR